MALQVRGLDVDRGRRPVLRGVAFGARSGSVTAVLGPNGAGKTTLLDAIAGLLPARAGSILLDGSDVSRLPAHERARLGMRLVGSRWVIPELTVADHFRLALDGRPPAPEIDTLFPRLRERRRTPAGQLSGGEQQMLALAVAIAAEPNLLLLDEPSFGLAPAVVDDVFAVLAALRDLGFTIVLAEQQALRALRVVDTAVVIAGGVVRAVHEVADENRDRIAAEIAESYLGTRGPARAVPARTVVEDLVALRLPVTLKRRLQLLARDHDVDPNQLASEQLESWLRRQRA